MSTVKKKGQVTVPKRKERKSLLNLSGIAKGRKFGAGNEREYSKKAVATKIAREDLGIGVRGKYYEEYKKGTNLVLLSPDVAAAFPDEDPVNSALRSLMRLAQHSVGPTRRSTRPAKKQAAG